MKKELIVALLATLMSVSACKQESHELAELFLDDTDRLICFEEYEGDFYLAALSGTRLKTAYRIEVTHPSGAPLSFLARWKVTDSNGVAVGLPAEPEIQQQGYHPDGSRLFAQEVSYRQLHLSNAQRLVVTFALTKFETGSANPPREIGAADEVLRCEIEL